MESRNHNGLTPLQQKVADRYLTNPLGGKVAAYRHVTGKAGSACYRLFEDPHVEAYIDRELDYLEELAQVSRERMILELSTIAYFDIRDLFDDDGNLKPIQSWPEHAARAVSAIDEETVVVGEGDETQTRRIKKLRTNGKLAALAELNRMMGHYQTVVEVKHGVLSALLERRPEGPMVPPGIEERHARSALETQQPLPDPGQGRGADPVPHEGGDVPLLPVEVVPKHHPEG